MSVYFNEEFTCCQVFFSEWQFSVRPLNGLAQVWQKCEVWSFFMATWRHHYESSLWRHHQLRRYLYNTLERMSTRREQIDLDHVLVNGDRRDWRDEIIKSTMPAACKRISNTKFKIIGGYKIRVKNIGRKSITRAHHNHFLE